MKLILLILGVAAIALNLILWYCKKKTGETKTDASQTNSNEFLNSPDVEPLKQSAAAELGISIEQLERMPVEEIEELATEKGLI
jgi:hypothetical protein